MCVFRKSKTKIPILSLSFNRGSNRHKHCSTIQWLCQYKLNCVSRAQRTKERKIVPFSLSQSDRSAIAISIWEKKQQQWSGKWMKRNEMRFSFELYKHNARTKYLLLNECRRRKRWCRDLLQQYKVIVNMWEKNKKNSFCVHFNCLSRTSIVTFLNWV